MGACVWGVCVWGVCDCVCVWVHVCVGCVTLLLSISVQIVELQKNGDISILIQVGMRETVYVCGCMVEACIRKDQVMRGCILGSYGG